MKTVVMSHHNFYGVRDGVKRNAEYFDVVENGVLLWETDMSAPILYAWGELCVMDVDYAYSMLTIENGVDLCRFMMEYSHVTGVADL